MYKILRFYNQNRYIIWIVIVAVILAIGVIRVLNNYAKEENRKSSSSNTTAYSDIYNNPEYPAITNNIKITIPTITQIRHPELSDWLDET